MAVCSSRKLAWGDEEEPGGSWRVDFEQDRIVDGLADEQIPRSLLGEKKELARPVSNRQALGLSGRMHLLNHDLEGFLDAGE